MAAGLKMKLILLLFIISNASSQEDTEMVQCMMTKDCNGPSSVILSRRECCVETDGLAFKLLDQQTCTTCIVFGWFQRSFSGQERETGYPLRVGYMKGGNGAQQSLLFNVVTTLNTALQSDFRVSSQTIRVEHMDVNPAEIMVTLQPDDIAQEPNESFLLRLEPISSLPTGSNIFFEEEVQVTIQDADNIEIMFTEDEYAATESDGVIQVRVSKNKLLASPITLRVNAMTIREAQTSGVPLPPNIPPDSSLAPNRADFADYTTVAVNVRFEQDEGQAQVLSLPTEILIVDDEINEAQEQYFIVTLSLAASLNQSSVSLRGRNLTLCKIIDNDPIHIGFERPNYTFLEPIFSERGFFDQVFLVKENNQVSEQSFRLEIRVSDVSPSNKIWPASLITQDTQSDRIINNDYRLTNPDQRRIFLNFAPNMQSIPFNFALFPDSFVEGTEAFLVNATPEESTPIFFPPNFLSSNTFIIIEDNDRSVIGFEQTNYTVREDDGMKRVCAVVIEPASPDAPFQLAVTLTAHTVNNTADEQDFKSIEGDVVLTLNNTRRRSCFDVKIFDDNIVEGDEVFGIILSFNTAPPPALVTLQPNTFVTIVDDDATEPTEQIATHTTRSTVFKETMKTSVSIATAPIKMIPRSAAISPTMSTIPSLEPNTNMPSMTNDHSAVKISLTPIIIESTEGMQSTKIIVTTLAGSRATTSLDKSYGISMTSELHKSSLIAPTSTTMATRPHSSFASSSTEKPRTIETTAVITFQRDPTNSITSTFTTAALLSPTSLGSVASKHTTMGSTTMSDTVLTSSITTHIVVIPDRPPTATTTIFTVGVIAALAVAGLLFTVVICTAIWIVMVKVLG